MIIRASTLHRVMNCKGSVVLAALSPPTEDSDAAREGTAAHEAAQMILTGTVTLGEELIDRRMSNGVYVTAEMIDDIAKYVTAVRGWTIEQTDDGWEAAPGVTVAGTADASQWDAPNATLRIGDLKYGWRIVEPFENWQLIAYAIGRGGLHESVEYIEMTIFQPRPWHPDGTARTWKITRAELAGYFEHIRQHLGALDDTLQTGEQCRYCAALPSCPAARIAAYNAVDVATRGGALEDQGSAAIATQLDALDRAADMLKLRRDALEDIAKARIQGGEVVPGWWVKESLGNRAWLDGVNADMVSAMTGVDVSRTDLITPAQAEKRGIDPATVATLTHRPSRGFKLVRSDGDTEARRAFQG